MFFIHNNILKKCLLSIVNFFADYFLLHYKTCKNKFYIINQKIDQIIDKIEPRKSQLKNKINQLTDDKKYSQEIENLWKDFKQLFDKKTGLNPDFSFSEMVIEIRELLGEGKGVATSTIKNFYQQKTNPRRKMIETIQEWVNKEKKKEVESEVDEDNENEENTNINNNIIDNNKNSSNSES